MRKTSVVLREMAVYCGPYSITNFGSLTPEEVTRADDALCDYDTFESYTELTAKQFYTVCCMYMLFVACALEDEGD